MGRINRWTFRASKHAERSIRRTIRTYSTLTWALCARTGELVWANDCPTRNWPFDFCPIPHTGTCPVWVTVNKAKDPFLCIYHFNALPKEITGLKNAEFLRSCFEIPYHQTECITFGSIYWTDQDTNSTESKKIIQIIHSAFSSFSLQNKVLVLFLCVLHVVVIDATCSVLQFWRY